MSYWFACIAVFLATYLLNIFYISVLYHRGLTHGSIRLRPWLTKWTAWTGNWVTGLDPKGWTCMHRMHHEYSDTPRDPHSPVANGIWSVFLGQLHSYNRTLVGLIRKEEPYVSVVMDLPFGVSWLNRHRLWIVPYLFHIVVGIALGFAVGGFWFGYAYWLGMMSHPIQGWMVNALAHTYGYRNFATDDNSRNNALVAYLVFGEGYQNNHHQYPARANFAVKGSEIDLGYALCRLGARFGLLDIPRPA